MRNAGSERRTARVGALAWISVIQFFVAQGVVRAAWTTPFSLSANYISDLGNTTCGPSRVGGDLVFVCSPLHAWMNLSFALFGIATVAGAVLLGPEIAGGRRRAIALALLCIAGTGILAVALFPEDRNFPMHKAGAALQFICGNLAMLAIGLGPRRRAWFTIVTLVLGGVASIATALFAADVYLGLGIGTMERLASYPLPLWLTIAGAVALGADPRHREPANGRA